MSSLGAALVGFALGCTIKARAFRIVVIVLAVAAVLFHLFAPVDWWVKPIPA